MEFPSLNDQLRSLVNREFPDYISVPSLADSSMYNILYFCSPKSVDQSWIKKKLKSILSQDDTDTRNSPLISLGWLFDHCPGSSDGVNAQEEPICTIHGQESGCQLSGGMGIDMLPVAECAGSASFEDKNDLNLGKIMKISLPYKQVSYWLKRVTPENSPELFREAKKRHLYVIYEVLTADYLKTEAEKNSNVNGTVANGGIKGTGSWKRNKGWTISRPKSMGRYPIAFKCGRVRLKKHKKHLELVGLKEFYEGFQSKHQNGSPSKSQTSSQEYDILNEDTDDGIHVKAEDTRNENSM